MRATTRREFLAGGAAVAVAPALAIDPIKRSAKPRLKLSLAAYSYRDFLTGKAQPAMSLEQFVDRCAAMNLDAVELTEYYFPKPVTAEYLARIKRQCYLLGLDISGSPMGNVFTHPPAAKRDAEIARVKEWIDWCELLGSPAIRIFAGGAQAGQSLEDARKCCVECIEIACEHAGKKGIMLTLENHGGIVAEADGLLAIVKAVKSDWFGVNLDTGNFRTEDPYADMARCAPYAVTVQVKTEVTPKGQPKQEADLKREMQILRDAGYRGYVTLEYEAAENPLEAVPRHIEKLRSLL